MSDKIIHRIAVTPGEPAGIGPDLTVQIAQSRYAHELVAVADPELLSQRAQLLGLPLRLRPFDPRTEARPQLPGEMLVVETLTAVESHPGLPDPANAAYVLDALRHACKGCLSGTFTAMVTGPINKAVINQAGFPFTGHTEFLAELCNAEPVMMLVSPGLRVALATTHLPLFEVSNRLTPGLLERVIRTLHHDLRSLFGISDPRILVCGLNPHAGEDGHLGREEIEVIEPVLERLRSEGMALIGPLPADTLFIPKNLAGSDAVLAMYHDQGLPVLKYQGFGRTVNVTLGLPIIRTSVDHGTALELAATGKADPGSMEMAIELAGSMARYPAARD